MRVAIVGLALGGCLVIDADERCAFEGLCRGASDTPISSIQRGEVPEGTVVEVRHALVTLVRDVGFYAQEPVGGSQSGLWVFATPAGMDELRAEEELAIGHLVDVTGTYTEYTGPEGDWTSSLTELADLDLDGSWSRGFLDTPIPDDIGAGDVREPWEGVLVRVQGELVTTDDPLPGELTGFSPYVWVADGGSKFLLAVPDAITVEPGTSLSAITGVVENRWSHWFLTPRSSSDVSFGG